MKSPLFPGTALCGLALVTQLLHAQAPTPLPTLPALPTPAAPAEAPATPSAPVEVTAKVVDLTPAETDDDEDEPGRPDSRRDRKPVKIIETREVQKARRAAEKAGEDVRRSVNDAMAQAQREIAKAKGEIARAQRIHTVTLKAGRTLVLPDGKSTAEAAAQSHEDLAVMARIFGKAASKSGRNQREFAFRFGEGRDLDALQIGGFGALFFVSVDYPVSPAAKAEPKKEKKESDADAVWEKEKKRLQRGGGEEEETDLEVEIEGFGDGEENPSFDEEQVRELKSRLASAFRHAANLRGVKDSEEIVVVVLGKANRGGSAKVRTEVFGGGPGSALIMSAFGVGETGATSFTLRARKSDIERLVKSKADDDALVKAVKAEDGHGIFATEGVRNGR